MDTEAGLVEAAQLFRVLGSESRLRILLLLSAGSRTVGALAEATEMSQPLVSQHLRTLRQGGLVTAVRNGKEMTYRLADQHVSHVISDALTHVQEPSGPDGTTLPEEPHSMPNASATHATGGGRGHVGRRERLWQGHPAGGAASFDTPLQ